MRSNSDCRLQGSKKPNPELVLGSTKQIAKEINIKLTPEKTIIVKIKNSDRGHIIMPYLMGLYYLEMPARNH